MAIYELRGTENERTGETHLWITRGGQAIEMEEVVPDLDSLRVQTEEFGAEILRLQDAWHAEMKLSARLQHELHRLITVATDANIWLFESGSESDRARVACNLNRVLCELAAKA